MKILIPFYSMYGHVYQMAQAVAEGARRVEGAQVELRRIAETLPDEVLSKMGALQAKDGWAHVQLATVAELVEADAIIFGVPTRFGNTSAQVRAFLDATGGLWGSGALVGKLASVFCSTSTQHGGQETTILTTMVTLLHHGMVLVGLPFTYDGLTNITEMSGCSPYGASTITGAQGQRMPSELELNGARFQGEHVAKLAAQLRRGALQPA